MAINKNFNAKNGLSVNGTQIVDSSGNVTIPATLSSPNLSVTNSTGDEGGEILLAKAQTNTTLVGTGVTIDVYQNKLRIFEQGGTARGVYIDLTAAGAGVSTNLVSGGSGTVTGVTATAPVISSGGTAPVISMSAASSSANGYLTSADWTTFNNKTSNTGTVTSVAALTLGTTGTDVSSTVANSTTTPVITLNIPTASATSRGALSAADWTTFNNKQPAGTYATGTGTASGTNTGDNAINTLYSGLVSNATHTGDATGSTALTLATVNSNIGTFNTVTVNGKGLVTAASNTVYLTAEADTLATVTGRGATTSTAVTFSGGITGNLTGNASGLSSILSIASGGTGTATPSLVAGTNVTISGTWPNQTIASTSTAATYTRTTFTATASQTIFTVAYTVGYAEVFHNGVLLTGSEYTAANGTSITLGTAAALNDIVEVIAYNTTTIPTANALTVGTGLSLDSGTTFNGSVAKTISLATSGASAGTYGNNYSGGSYLYLPQFTVDTYGRITSITSNYVSLSGGSTANSFSTIYAGAGGTLSSPTSGSATMLSASSSTDSLYLIAGSNITITAATSPSKAIMISSTGGASSGVTWTSNTTSSGNVAVTNPTGYSTTGSTLVIVVVGTGSTATSASSGSASFSSAMTVGSNTKVYYTSTGSSLGATTTISGAAGYVMAYAYIGGGNTGLSSNSGYSSSTSYSMTSPSPNFGSPKIIAVSTSSTLNLSTVASTASGGGPTWATGSGFVHPNDSMLTAAVWVGTGSWTTSATATLTSNSSMMGWYLTGLTSYS